MATADNKPGFNGDNGGLIDKLNLVKINDFSQLFSSFFLEFTGLENNQPDQAKLAYFYNYWQNVLNLLKNQIPTDYPHTRERRFKFNRIEAETEQSEKVKLWQIETFTLISESLESSLFDIKTIVVNNPSMEPQLFDYSLCWRQGKILCEQGEEIRSDLTDRIDIIQKAFNGKVWKLISLFRFFNRGSKIVYDFEVAKKAINPKINLRLSESSI